MGHRDPHGWGFFLGAREKDQGVVVVAGVLAFAIVVAQQCHRRSGNIDTVFIQPYG